MVQLFQRYVPYTTIVDFLVQSLLCVTAFGVVVQVAWWTQFDPTLPAVPGVRAGRALTSVAVLVLVFYLTGYFERRNHLSTSLYVPRLLQAVPLGGLTLSALYQFVPHVALGWEVAVTALLLMSVLMIAWHLAAPSLVGRDGVAERVLLIGDGPLAADIADRVGSISPWGFELAGYIPVQDWDDDETGLPATARFGDSRTATGPRACAAPGIAAHARVVPFPVPRRIDAPSLGRLQDLEELLIEHDVHTVVVALTDRRGKLPLTQLINAKLRGVTVYEAVDFYERLTGRMMVARMRPSAIIFAEGFSSGRLTKLVKRSLDVMIAGGLLVFGAPLLLVTGLAVRLTSRGPVLFRQERVGFAGIPFTMLKFRSMYEDAERDGPQWAARDDDRITPVGRFLRKSRLDELPQLWNVLMGHMSFVGPRPERPCFVRELRQEIPYYDQRHAVRPGITGWAQVKYPYGATVEAALEKLEFDLYYIKRMSVAFDLTILIETVRVLLTGRGAR